MSASQAESRGFESLLPLSGDVGKWLSQGSAKPPPAVRVRSSPSERPGCQVAFGLLCVRTLKTPRRPRSASSTVTTLTAIDSGEMAVNDQLAAVSAQDEGSVTGPW